MRTLILWTGIALVANALPANGQPTADALLAAAGAAPGTTVCEIGAGSGALTLTAAALVGPNGHVFTNELGTERVENLRAATAGKGLSNITVVPASPVSTNFPDGACDAVVMRDVYHHFSDPGSMNIAISRALKRGGRLAIVDFTPPPGSRAPTPADRGKDGMHGIHPEEMKGEVAAAGFEVAQSDVGGRWFMLVFTLKR